mgnify:CR=1 FL=1
MPGHKTTHTQLERFRLIDSMLSDGEVLSFEKILDSLRLELRDDFLSESSLRRDFRYMKNELGAPLAYDKNLHGWHYSKTFKLPAEGFSDDEILYLKLIRGLVNQNSNDDFLYQAFDKLLSKITPDTSDDAKEPLKQVQCDSSPQHGDSYRHAELVSASLYDRFYISPRPKQLIDPSVVEKILEAIKHNYLLDFNYFSKWEPEERHRKIMPFQLVFDYGSLYLYAASINPKVPGPRLYKLSKMHNVELVKSRTFKLPANFRFRETFEEGRFGAFQYDEAYDFKIEFSGEARSMVREYVWADNQTKEENQKEGTTIISFTSSQWIPIFRWLLSFGENARPLEPDFLVEQWKESIEKMYKNL